jgi:uncharacterized protein YjbJ (UPF0337 family)
VFVHLKFEAEAFCFSARLRSQRIGSVLVSRELKQPDCQAVDRGIFEWERLVCLAWRPVVVPLVKLGRRRRSNFNAADQHHTTYGSRRAANRGEVMNSDQVKGAAQKTGGKIKEEFGKMTGNPDTQAKGKFDQAKGQARETVGDAKEVLKGKK